jgi:hypothetical protein
MFCEPFSFCEPFGKEKKEKTNSVTPPKCGARLSHPLALALVSHYTDTPIYVFPLALVLSANKQQLFSFPSRLFNKKKSFPFFLVGQVMNTIPDYYRKQCLSSARLLF